ncbi:hypothetical protein M501DRAFT_928154 [Patellaria atrata CBS 101060]|uniref:ER-bound oxygenase mpaB/mpaB'/Rubber oxygenase catalytic domain-containing protein n=1 Tax=Patellaria atrata CBS 101060 TaxID=1346257 RepID=A0A9P4SIE3_9PEZI|nr:hypothetical protein M501DRAFT_928154 [Patellaria atrata CBS 101060]
MGIFSSLQNCVPGVSSEHNLRWYHILTASFIGYTAICQALRFRHRNALQAKYPYKTRADCARMTVDHAFEISLMLSRYEFPLMTLRATQFALFRTYGIPTISKLLCQTGQLSNKADVSKRYADTEIVVAEIKNFGVDHERSCGATARMNYIHSVYQKSGLISNDDMIYTIALFAMEPVKWIYRYEWRDLTTMEKCAIGTFWKSQGEAMNIDYSPLKSGKDRSWKDGLQWLNEIMEWTDDYEKRCMVPDPWNHMLANETTDLLLYKVSKRMKPYGRKVISAIMDDRLRTAMKYEVPPKSYFTTINAVFAIRRFILRWLMPPRPWFLPYRTISPEPDSKTGRLHRKYYESEPWYVPATFGNRYGLGAWMNWLAGRPIPEKKFRPEGFLIEEIGPRRMEGKGMDEFKEMKERLMRAGRGGCPFPH